MMTMISMRWAGFTLLFALLFALLLPACSGEGNADTADIDRLKGFWVNDSGLYYLDLSGPEAAAFVLPNDAATLTPLALSTLTNQDLVLSDGQSRITLRFSRLPPASGADRCLEIDSARLCESPRD